MRSWLLQAPTGLQRLVLGDAPDPRPGAREVVLQVEFAALNPADRYLAEAQYPARPTFPHILGRDGIGTVVEVGHGVNHLKPGDRRVILRSEVGVNRPGTFAERVAVPVESLAAYPPEWSPEQAAAAPLVYLTAYQALTMWGSMQNASILISGASGGVGVAATQLASIMGHTVIALSRDEAKRKRLLTLGARHAFDPTQPAWRELVKEAIGGRRIDLAIDNVGGEHFADMIDTLGNNGRVSIVGRLAGPVPMFNTATLIFRRIRIGGVSVGAYSAEESQAAWRDIMHLMRRGQQQPLVDRVYAFEDLPAAFERLAAGPMGKVVLKVR